VQHIKATYTKKLGGGEARCAGGHVGFSAPQLLAGESHAARGPRLSFARHGGVTLLVTAGLRGGASVGGKTLSRPQLLVCSAQSGGGHAQPVGGTRALPLSLPPWSRQSSRQRASWATHQCGRVAVHQLSRRSHEYAPQGLKALAQEHKRDVDNRHRKRECDNGDQQDRYDIHGVEVRALRIQRVISGCSFDGGAQV